MFRSKQRANRYLSQHLWDSQLCCIAYFFWFAAMAGDAYQYELFIEARIGKSRSEILAEDEPAPVQGAGEYVGDERTTPRKYANWSLKMRGLPDMFRQLCGQRAQA